MRVKDKDKVDFAELKTGDCFINYDGSLMFKTNYKQSAVDLRDGCLYSGLCGGQVTPVNAEVHIVN